MKAKTTSSGKLTNQPPARRLITVMCGIYGCIGHDYRKIREIFHGALRHRGPDDDGAMYDDAARVMLGHTRLAVIDLSREARQPMTDESEQFVLVFNGEVYNYKELRKELSRLGYEFFSDSDSEVVLKGFVEWGAGCLARFRGMFAFCVYDKSRREFFLARDRFGIKPLIYSLQGKHFLFSSELKPLLDTGLVPRKLDRESAGEYFLYGSVAQPKTIVDNVFHLMPGHYMRIGTDLRCRIESYYDLTREAGAYTTAPPSTYEDAVCTTRRALEEATRYHMVADVEVGGFLSGGIDSSAVVALMQQHSEVRINTFSLGFRDVTEVADETAIAARTARALGTNHHEIRIDGSYISKRFEDFVDSIDQPSVDGLNTYVISREAAASVKVAISGLGGDEIFAGYPHFTAILDASNRRRNLLSRSLSLLHRHRPNRYTKKYVCFGRSPEAAVRLMRRADTTPDLRFDTAHSEGYASTRPELSPLRRICRAEIDHYLLSTLLRDNDVLSMASSLEVRPVLLDHKLVEWAFSLDDSLKLRSGQLKSVFTDSVKDLVPEETWRRRKSGFELPFATWLNHELNEQVSAAACDRKANELFQDRYLRVFRKRAKRKTLRRYDWPVFVFLRWYVQHGFSI